jgi:AcrR family transcriptional regulator
MNNVAELRPGCHCRNGRFDERLSKRTFDSICPMTIGMPTIESRGERTRDTILRAFVALMFRDGFDHITVQNIVAEAGIARSTFYEHFGRKEDVLRASMAQFFVVLARCVSSDDQPAELARVLDHFWENRRLTDAIFDSAPRRILALSLSEMVEAQLRERSGELVLPARLAAIHIAEAQLALVETWLRGRAFAHASDVATALHKSSLASAAALSRANSPVI